MNCTHFGQDIVQQVQPSQFWLLSPKNWRRCGRCQRYQNIPGYYTHPRLALKTTFHNCEAADESQCDISFVSGLGFRQIRKLAYVIPCLLPASPVSLLSFLLFLLFSTTLYSYLLFVASWISEPRKVSIGVAGQQTEGNRSSCLGYMRMIRSVFPLALNMYHEVQRSVPVRVVS